MELHSRLTAYTLLFLSIIAAATALAYTSTMMIPFAFSVFIAILVSPLVNYLNERLKLPRWAAASIGILAVVGVMFFLGAFVFNFVRGIFDNVDSYQIKLSQAALQITAQLNDWGFEIDPNMVRLSLRELPLFSYATTAAGRIFSISSDIILIIIFLIFLLSGKRGFLSSSGVMARIASQVRRYIITKFFISLVTGVVTIIVLWSFGLDMALTFGAFAFVLNFIPTLGSIIATVLPIPVALLQFDTYFTTILMVSILTVTQFVIGSIIDPKLIGHTLDLHPAIVLLSLMFWGLIWGIAGMFLAVPIMLVIKLMLEQYPNLAPVAHVLAGRNPEQEKSDEITKEILKP